MTFRQNEIFVKQFLWTSGILTAVMEVLFLRDRAMLLPLLVCLGMLLGPAVHVWRTEPMVTVDELGGVCGDPERPLWAYSWAEIAQIRRITRFTSPAAQLIPIEEPIRDIPLLGFQLSRRAKTALRKYCPGYRE